MIKSLFVVAAAALLLKLAEPAVGQSNADVRSGTKTRSEPIRPPSRWDKNGDGRLDAEERRAMYQQLQQPSRTDESEKKVQVRSRLRKVGLQPDRRTERIRRALGKP